MREDLNKQLCERQRHGSKRKYSAVRNKRLFAGIDDEGPIGGRESMKHRHVISWNERQLNENLNPLWGIVRKNVGRPWDKVYSEICEVFDRRSVINQHILTHLLQFVDTKTFMQDGEVWAISSWGKPRPLDRMTEFYVHPETGLLQKNPGYQTYEMYKRERAKKLAAEKHKIHRVIDDTTELLLVNGVWFVVTMNSTPREYEERIASTYSSYKKQHEQTRVVKEYPNVFDVVTNTYVAYPYQSRYAVSKRTASHKELKKYGIIK